METSIKKFALIENKKVAIEFTTVGYYSWSPAKKCLTYSTSNAMAAAEMNGDGIEHTYINKDMLRGETETFTSNFVELEESISYENKDFKDALQKSVKFWKALSKLDEQLAIISKLEDSGVISKNSADEKEAEAVAKDNELKNSIFEITHEYSQDTKYVGGAFALKGVATLIIK